MRVEKYRHVSRRLLPNEERGGSLPANQKHRSQQLPVAAAPTRTHLQSYSSTTPVLKQTLPLAASQVPTACPSSGWHHRRHTSSLMASGNSGATSGQYVTARGDAPALAGDHLGMAAMRQPSQFLTTLPHSLKNEQPGIDSFHSCFPAMATPDRAREWGSSSAGLGGLAISGGGAAPGSESQTIRSCLFLLDLLIVGTALCISACKPMQFGTIFKDGYYFFSDFRLLVLCPSSADAE